MTESESNVDQRSHGDERSLAEELTTDQSETVSLIGHFYRGEMERMVSWRTRLDQTTNWAVVVMAAILTFVFSSGDNPHYVVLIGILGVLVFLVIESQRYQEYDAWRYRVRILQRQFFADVVGQTRPSRADWRDHLGEDLRSPTLVISRVGAIGHRLKRVYLLLLSVLLAAWLLRISVFAADSTWRQTAAVGDVSGTVVVGVVLGVYLALAGLALWSVVTDRMREFSGDQISDSA